MAVIEGVLPQSSRPRSELDNSSTLVQGRGTPYVTEAVRAEERAAAKRALDAKAAAEQAVAAQATTREPAAGPSASPGTDTRAAPIRPLTERTPEASVATPPAAAQVKPAPPLLTPMAGAAAQIATLGASSSAHGDMRAGGPTNTTVASESRLSADQIGQVTALITLLQQEKTSRWCLTKGLKQTKIDALNDLIETAKTAPSLSAAIAVVETRHPRALAGDLSQRTKNLLQGLKDSDIPQQGIRSTGAAASQESAAAVVPPKNEGP